MPTLRDLLEKKDFASAMTPSSRRFDDNGWFEMSEESKVVKVKVVRSPVVSTRKRIETQTSLQKAGLLKERSTTLAGQQLLRRAYRASEASDKTPPTISSTQKHVKHMKAKASLFLDGVFNSRKTPIPKVQSELSSGELAFTPSSQQATLSLQRGKSTCNYRS